LDVRITVTLIVTITLLLNACGNSVEEASKIPPNFSPNVNNDVAGGFRNESLTIDVLANDTDPEGGALSLVSYEQPLNGTVAENNQLLEYTPNANYSGTDSFNYTVADSKGNISRSIVDITVSPWNKPTQIGNGKGIELAVSDNGQAVAVWIDGATLYTNQFLLGNRWQTALPLYTATGAGNISSQQVAINAFGQAMAVWKSVETDANNATTSKFGSGLLSGALWTTETLPWTQVPSDQATAIDIALNDNGSAALVWDEVAPTNLNNLWAKSYSSLSWDNPTIPLVALAAEAKQPKVEFKSASTVVAWSQSIPSSIWWQTKFSANWGVPTQLNTNTNIASDVQLAMSPNDNGIIIWREQDATTSLIRLTGRLFQLQENSAPLLDLPFYLDNGEGSVTAVSLDSDNLGNFAISWQQTTLNGSAIYVYHVSGSNRILTEVSMIDENNPNSPSISLANNGNIVVAWHEGENIVVRRYDNTWLQIASLMNGVLSESGSLQVGSDANANLVAVWRLADGGLWSSDFCLDPTTCEAAVAEHELVVEACINCHDGANHTGKKLEHMPTFDSCHVCHNTNTWLPATLNHSATSAACVDCHNGISVAGTPDTGHFETNLSCGTCHLISTWLSAKYTHLDTSNYPGDHRRANRCIDCHKDNSQVVIYLDTLYVPFCASCHSRHFSAKAAHIGGTSGTVEQNKDCGASGCHRVNDSFF